MVVVERKLPLTTCLILKSEVLISILWKKKVSEEGMRMWLERAIRARKVMGFQVRFLGGTTHSNVLDFSLFKNDH